MQEGLFEGKGNKDALGNYNGISLVSAFGKLDGRVVMSNMKGKRERRSNQNSVD